MMIDRILRILGHAIVPIVIAYFCVECTKTKVVETTNDILLDQFSKNTFGQILKIEETWVEDDKGREITVVYCNYSFVVVNNTYHGSSLLPDEVSTNSRLPVKIEIEYVHNHPNISRPKTNAILVDVWHIVRAIVYIILAVGLSLYFIIKLSAPIFDELKGYLN